jgi:hypothetical protein
MIPLGEGSSKLGDGNTHVAITEMQKLKTHR